jgi:hypothetical protein
MNITKILFASLLFVEMVSLSAFAQSTDTKKKPQLSKHQLAMDNLKTAKAGLIAAQQAWDNILHSYGPGARKTRESYLAHINVAEAKANVCEAENDAEIVRCKTTSLRTDNSYLIDILYFHSDGSTRGIHYYFADHADGTYEDSETAFTSSH